MNLVIATNNKNLIEALTHKYTVLASFFTREELERDINNLIEEPDILFVTEGFNCQGVPIADLLIKIKKNNPDLRIIYVQSSEFTSGTKKILTRMVENEIYDIAIGDEIDLPTIEKLIENPKTYGDASKILESDDTEVYPNIFTISSLKPGTGKTFLATNLAVAIAKYGQKKRLKNGRLTDPRVLLVDGDLLNLGVGTMLRTDNYDRNMLTALQRIAKFIPEDCRYTMSDSDVENIKKYVRACLCEYRGCSNLYIMAANTISLDELAHIAPVHFYFMMQMLVRAFDVIIVDSNSAFDHQTTAVLYELSGSIFLMLDNDYNNIQNNLRYVNKLAEMGYDDKIHFIVNKDLTREAEMNCLEDLDYNTHSIGDLVLEYRIPLIDAGIIKTIDYGEELVVTSNKAKAAKDKILEIADSIWKIDYSKVEVSSVPTKKPNKIINILNN